MNLSPIFRNLLFVLIFILTGKYKSDAQCVIYNCNKTGAWGYAYDDGAGEIPTYKEIDQKAKNECMKNGGTNCVQVVSSYDTGWYGVIIFPGDDKINSGGFAAHEISKRAAERELIRILAQAGGQPLISEKVWFVNSRRSK